MESGELGKVKNWTGEGGELGGGHSQKLSRGSFSRLFKDKWKTGLKVKEN